MISYGITLPPPPIREDDNPMFNLSVNFFK